MLKYNKENPHHEHFDSMCQQRIRTKEWPDNTTPNNNIMKRNKE